MLVLRNLLLVIGAALLLAAAALLIHDIYRVIQARRGPDERPARPVRWRDSGRLGLMSILPMLLGLSIVVIPSGFAGVRISQLSGPRPGTLYPGVHGVWPLVEQVELYNTRDQVYTTAIAADPKAKQEGLRAQTKEGLTVGLAVAVRYRLDPAKLYAIHTTLPAALEEEVVAPVVSSAFREMTTNYPTKELFANKREEVRHAAEAIIAKHLAKDGIIAREVILRDLQLPGEYAKGLEMLLLKEQENERLTVELEAKQKQVKVALMEAESQKEIAIKNAEGMAQAKVLDSKAELERLTRMADAEEIKIRRVAAANSEKMRLEAEVLKQNPALIQKIIAERISDKLQIMMVPSDGKNFFMNDVLRSAMSSQAER